ncbi:MAG: glycosyltransferase family 39 protein [Elusimicrobiota bacterium]
MTSKYFHAAAYHPDESEVLKAYQGINPKKLDFRLSTVTVQTKGTFQPYLMAVWIKIASVFKLVKISSSFDYYKANPRELVKLYVTGRSLSIFFGILTVILLFFMAKIFYNDYRIGLLSAFLLAITPIHAIWSHYIGTDALLTFEVCLVFLLCFYILKNGSNKIYLFTGLLVGLTGATKYSIIPLTLIPVIAHYLSSNKFFNKKLFLYLLFVPAGFILGNPYSVLEPRCFYETLKYSSQINVTVNSVLNPLDSFGPQPMFLYYLTTAPKYSFGIPLAILFLFGFIFAFIRKEKIDIVIIVWMIIFYLFIALSSPWQSMRWQLPYIPVLCLLSAKSIFVVLENISKKLKILILLIVACISIATLFYSVAYMKMMTEKDVRDESSEWIEKNIPEGKKIAVPDVYFWNPSIVMTNYWYKETEPFYANIKKYKIFQTEWDIKKLEKINPDYVVLADYEYYPILKLKDKYPHPELMPFLEEIMQSDRYTLIKKFEKKPKLFGIIPIGGFFPPEFRMVNPTILIYKKLI